MDEDRAHSGQEPPLHLAAYRAYLLALTRGLLRSSGLLRAKVDASDVVQETLMQAHLALAQFRGTTAEELAGWLRTILANKLADIARHYGRAKRDAALERSFLETLDQSSRRLGRLVPAGDPSPSQQVLRFERIGLLAEALAELPADQQLAVELHHLGGLSVVETATTMGRSTASVAGLLRRGLKGLREHLKPLEHELR